MKTTPVWLGGSIFRYYPMKDRITTIDQWIRRAQGNRAREALLGWAKGRIASRDAAAFASLACRAGLPELGVRRLHPIVRPLGRFRRLASPEEIAEYANCLIQWGAPEEGAALLQRLDPETHPEVLLYRARALEMLWDYAGALPLLTRYIEKMRHDDYQRTIGEVHLAAALIYERNSPAVLAILRNLLYTASLRRYDSLLGHCLQLCATYLLASHRWKAARDFLDHAVLRTRESEGIDRFLINRDQCLVDVLEKKDETSREALREFRQEAARQGQWETLRHCDRLVALKARDAGLFRHLYYGTPLSHYREKLLRDWSGEPPALGDGYLRTLGGEGASRDILDLATAGLGQKTAILEVGSLPHRMLTTLASDFYRPWRLVTLHSQLYPGRIFNPSTSPATLYDVKRRLREAFHKHRIPLFIEERRGFYTLKASAPFRLLYSLEPLPRDQYLLRELRKRGLPPRFSLADAIRALDLPRRSVQRLLKRGREGGVLQRTGNGITTVYRFTDS